jgi:hypothetical protein
MGLPPIVSPLSVRADKMGVQCRLGGGAAAADDGEGDNEDKLHVGGVMNLGNQERPEVEQLWRGATQAIAGTCYERTIVSFHKHIFGDGHPLKICAPSLDPANCSLNQPWDGAGNFYQARSKVFVMQSHDAGRLTAEIRAMVSESD